MLTRRFSHGLSEAGSLRRTARTDSHGSFTRFPDLIMMDGGKGQVNVALAVLENPGTYIPVCGMVKDDIHRTRGLYYNNVEMPIDRTARVSADHPDTGRGPPLRHRVSPKPTEQGPGDSPVLDDIPGIGPARRKALMRYFKDIEAIRAAEVELSGVPQMNKRSAKQVYDFFH